MKLVFDENLSPKLVQLLAGDFPGSVHVHDIGLGGADDKTVWRHAANNGFMIVSKDSEQLLQGLRKIHDLQKQFDQIARDTTTHFSGA